MPGLGYCLSFVKTSSPSVLCGPERPTVLRESFQHAGRRKRETLACPKVSFPMRCATCRSHVVHWKRGGVCSLALPPDGLPLGGTSFLATTIGRIKGTSPSSAKNPHTPLLNLSVEHGILAQKDVSNVHLCTSYLSPRFEQVQILPNG
jgi:hypothetical protein